MSPDLDVSTPILWAAFAGLFFAALIILVVTHWRQVEDQVIARMWMMEAAVGCLAFLHASLTWSEGSVWLTIMYAMFGVVMLAPAVKRGLARWR
ncbi:hypothetical protein JW805_06655 [Roseomonas aeriglobus]|nr:hypothetical protein [Roseomonas aeriglobus]